MGFFLLSGIDDNNNFFLFLFSEMSVTLSEQRRNKKVHLASLERSRRNYFGIIESNTEEK